jgi:hypothetical protein
MIHLPLAANIALRRTAAEPALSGAQAAFLSRCTLLQAIAGAFIAMLWMSGLAAKPFEGESGIVCAIILAVGAAGILCVYLQRWNDVQWIATHVVRIGLLGTVVGLIIAFSAASTSAGSSPDEVRTLISSVVNGMYVSLYATLLGIGVNLWLKINLRLLAGSDG